ncbi:MAG: DEAD/DEAH box helicase, partial [Candidatus Aenigmarchaeota archaeon]|nr:DEAD/DEAH box helicase [Candidatus Aenigmarchaeota archaeon]
MESAFNLLEKDLRKLVAERFKKPTPIQQTVIPEILKGENVLVLSETGSGKTESCLLPIFNFWAKNQPNANSILYITPLRSLNRDLQKRILWWANHLDFSVSVRHGDTTPYERNMQAENPPDMLIVTPETLQAILTGKKLREHLKNIKHIIIDEIHELVESKRGVQLSIGLERLKYLIKEAGNQEPQIIGLSATVGSPEDVADFLSGSSEKCKIINTISSKALKLKVDFPVPKKGYNRDADKIFVSTEAIARIRKIKDVIDKSKSTLVFTNTRMFTEVLSSRIKTLYPKLPIDAHHSSLSKEVRIDAENDFRAEKLKALIATSSLELGIDIGAISSVIQYMSPRQVSKFLQRVGRSGHSLQRISEGLIIATDDDDCFESAIISKLALEGKIEPTIIYPKSFDVLANQIIGFCMERYNVPLDFVFKIIKKAYPFRELTKKEVLKTCEIMKRLGFLWINQEEDGLILRRSKKAFEYYFTNLTMIPDVKNYQVFDTVSNRPVGTLDAEFVALHGSPGTTFITKGEAWRVIDAIPDKNRLLVEPAGTIDASIPAWEGELIPIPFKVAQGVGELRKSIESSDSTDSIVKNYPITKNVAKKMVKIIKEQKKYGFVPNNKEMLIEYGRAEDFWVIIHSCFGSMVNETIGRALSMLLTTQLGSVGLQTDAYRIMLKLKGPDYETVIKTFKKLESESLSDILKFSLKNTELFNWRFIHVAKRFGVISKGADFGKAYISKVAGIYAGTPVYKEALNEIFQEKLDLKTAGNVLDAIESNDVRITVKEGLSPLGVAGLREKFEIHAAEKPEKEIFDI